MLNDYIYTYILPYFYSFSIFVQKNILYIFSTSHNFYQNTYSRFHFPHFSEREIETQRSKVTFQGPENKSVAKLELNPTLYEHLITKLHIFVFMYTHIQNINISWGGLL